MKCDGIGVESPNFNVDPTDNSCRYSLFLSHLPWLVSSVLLSRLRVSPSTERFFGIHYGECVSASGWTLALITTASLKIDRQMG